MLVYSQFLMSLKLLTRLIAIVCLMVYICRHGQSVPESAAAATSSAAETMGGKSNLALHQSFDGMIYAPR